MKTYKLILILLSLTLTLHLMAQSDSVFQKPNVDISGTIYNQSFRYDGTPFLLNDWFPAEVKLSNGKTALIEKTKFDQLTNSLLFYNEGLKRIFTIENQTIEYFTINANHEKYHFERYLGPTIKLKLHEGKFVQLFSTGNYTLGAYHFSTIKNPEAVNTKSKIIPDVIYFVEYKNTAAQIRLKKRSIYNLFPERKLELRKIMSELHVRNNSEESFTKLFNHLNSLNSF